MAELKHISHECALSVPKIVENGICNICYKDEPVEYACDPCNFDLCKTCSYLPQKVSHDFHREHPLEFCLPQNDQKQTRYIICNGCGNMSSGCFYECKECEIYLDLHCAFMEKISRGWDAKELLSEHHAHLVKRCRPGPDARGSCLLCELPLSPSAICYGCVHCYLFFHEHCLSEIPTMIQHPVHPSHPLKRFDYIQNCGAHGRKCDACGGKIYSVPFGCLKCNFKLHLRCADALLRGLMHHSHEHRLFYVNTSGVNNSLGKSHDCQICKDYCRRPFYYCILCDLKFHLECLEIPNSVVDKSHHIHPLVCKVYLDDENEDSLEYCGVCEVVVNTGHHAYCCETCDFLGHIECILSKGAATSPLYLKDLYFCGQDTMDQDDSKTINLENKLVVNNVWGHTHVLRSIALSELDERAKCNICSGIIYGKACKCETCSFQTHNFCAELGIRRIRRFHSDHPLTLLPYSPVAGLSVNCDICREQVSGFNLFCRICSFIIHVQCVLKDNQFLGTLHRGQKLMVRNAQGECIKRNTHRMFGATVSSSYLITCTICEERLCGKVVSCIDCREVYHPWCIKGLRRRISLHPLHYDHDLRFLVVSGSKCIVCKLIITKYGYTCRKCEVSFHFKCVQAVDIPKEIKYHFHCHYNFWEEYSTRVCSVCARRCGASFYGCIECNFSAHVECVGVPGYVKNQRHQHTVELKKSKDINWGKKCCSLCGSECKARMIYLCKLCRETFHVKCIMSTVVDHEFATEEDQFQDIYLMYIEKGLLEKCIIW